MRRIVFVDLDDTLFQTHRKKPAADHPAAMDRDGHPLSFRCGRQVAFFEWLARDATVIPVTGRNVDAFRRVTLPFDSLAVCSFGGVILAANGQPDPVWHARMAQAADRTAPVLQRLLEGVAEAAADQRVDVRYRIIQDAGLPLYISVKLNAGDVEDMSRLGTAITSFVPDDWTIHLNATNLAVLPPFLGKAAAVAYVQAALIGEEPVLTVGVGDSLTDVAFMGLCDFAVAPSDSQIMAALSARTPLPMAAGA
ncbi:hypothetical protein F1188_09655 [Roseospira marina]|uniref:Sucrose phosphatase-like domain-containing protein n=1 Tax=Roseospira marina TaxID=140057 RepID=A0A5M6IDR3_9PROT|nr:hypothetical protein [Roseospira marina]KAA5605865.1 hypothetical protein F1188_09655 [Roseospira marina]MBB4313685.1 hydroxymethylpyrimidine pyrophosphatase-like HAD family hydrolase [Roseospira marina]MBB5086847.1 hydroxymethylpyrimidine pyrophosphatase-like HAD family hydrolase [Roseospira marina]